MVKNSKGGSGHKKLGRKHVSSNEPNKKIRYKQDDDEIYAICTRIYGSGHVLVKCSDMKERLCVIRNKFRGRGKRDDMVVCGSYLLIGARSYEVRAADKLERCDLMEVYNDNEKNMLIQHETSIPWTEMTKDIDSRTSNTSYIESNHVPDLEFVDEKTIKYEDIFKKNEAKPPVNDTTDDCDDDIIDIDDI